jgi:aryl-alcohol dehydrogenase-like predicted oxidoreductase
MRYLLLGRSGLRVSELSLGTMTFGSEWGWGSDQRECANVLDAFLDAGGNFVDTADYYVGGRSEEILGELLGRRRDRVVLATKYTDSAPTTDPNASGNHRKHLRHALDASLRRLQTDYVDVLYVHTWDFLSPVEEVMRALDDVVRAGKVLYLGVSDTPAWVVAQANTLARAEGWTPFVVTQIEYNLNARTPERELLPMAQALDLGVTAWSPLAGGLMTGKYRDRAPATGGDGSRRLDTGFPDASTARTAQIVDELVALAAELDATPAQVQLAWLLAKDTIPVLGARSADQLQDNLGSLRIELSPDAIARLDTVSRIELGFPHDYLVHEMPNSAIYGGMLGRLHPHRPEPLPPLLRDLHARLCKADRTRILG